MKWWEVQPEDVAELLAVTNSIKAIKSHKEKKEFVTVTVPNLRPEVSYLFSVFLYHSLFNSRWAVIDISNYFTVRKKNANESTAEDFIKLLRAYDRKKPRLRKDSKLFKFLQLCDKPYFDFYASLLEKKFHEGLPLTECQELLNLEEVSLSDIYDPEEKVRENLEALTFPVAITRVDHIEAEFVIFVKRTDAVYCYKIVNGQLKTTWGALYNIRSTSTIFDQPVYAVAGIRVKIDDPNFAGRRKATTAIRNKKRNTTYYKFIPMDLFKDRTEIEAYINGEEVTPFIERYKNLQEFLDYSFVFGSSDDYVGFANSEQDLQEEVTKLLGKNKQGYLVFYDENSVRTMTVSAKKCATVETVIDSLWVEGEEVKGFIVWHNAEMHKVALDLPSKHKGLLKNPQALKTRVLDCIYFRVNDKCFYFPVQFNFNSKFWGSTRAGVYLTCCCVCGGTEYKHDGNGICTSCLMNMYNIFRRVGPNNWHNETRNQQKKRSKVGWHHSILDNAKVRFQGYRLKGRVDGAIMYVPDEEAQAKYEHEISKQGWNKNLKKSKMKGKI